MMTTRKIVLVVILFTVIGVGLGVLGSVVAINKYPDVICLESCKDTITEQKYFYSDDIFIYAKDSNDNPLVINLSLNRKKLGDFYHHYYYSNLIVGEFKEQEYTSFHNPSEQVKPDAFLTNFTNQLNEDLSTRESFSFSYEHGPVNIKVASEELLGDFITKNSLEYTRYITEGKATLNIGGQTYPARIAVIKSYSANYDKYVYFDGYETLRSFSQQYIFWDDKENFYLIDQSEVYKPNPFYKSHTWVLYKDADTQSMKKAFRGEIKIEEVDGVRAKWTIDIPDLSTKLMLQAYSAFNDKASGIVTGTVDYQGLQGAIGGYFSNTDYGK